MRAQNSDCNLHLQTNPLLPAPPPFHFSFFAQVGNTPGVTKAVQEVHLDKNIKLLDSPGIVFAAAEDDASAVLRNCVKIEKLKDPSECFLQRRQQWIRTVVGG